MITREQIEAEIRKLETELELKKQATEMAVGSLRSLLTRLPAATPVVEPRERTHHGSYSVRALVESYIEMRDQSATFTAYDVCNDLKSEGEEVKFQTVQNELSRLKKNGVVEPTGRRGVFQKAQPTAPRPVLTGFGGFGGGGA